MSLRAQLDLVLQRIGVEIRARTPKRLTLTANVSVTSNVLAAVAGTSFNVTAGKFYHVKIIGKWQSGQTANGAQFGFTGTATVTNVAGSMRAGLTSLAAATELAVPISTLASTLVATAVNLTNTPQSFLAEYVFSCTAGGTHQMRFASEVNGQTSTLLPGTTIIYQEIV